MSEEQTKEQETPKLTLEGNRAAVIKEILRKLVVQQEGGDDTSQRVALEIDQWGSISAAIFNRWTNHHIIQAEDDKVNHLMPSNEVMDKLCAAWIAWRTQHYEPPKEGDSLGDLDDHPF
jgi:hypothetical protein